MKQYERYKESGVEWLERVPEHWEVVPGLQIFRENKHINNNNKITTVLSLSYGKIVVKSEDKLTGLVPQSFETYQIVNINDIIIRCTDLQNDKESLRIGFVENAGIITNAYLGLIIIGGYFPKFIYYYLHRWDLTKAIYKFGSGLRQNLAWNDIKRLAILLPSFNEQACISDYLDQKCAQIDKAISQKERVIDLLNERRQIIIQRAVTRGLDPDVPMKDSGVDWIGEIPEHWEVKKIKHFGNIKSGDPITNSSIKDTGRYEVFGGNGLMGYTDKFNIEEERIIIGRVGALCGNIRMSDTRRFVTDNALIYCCNNRDIIKYLVILLRAANLNRLNTSNAQPLITGTKVLNVKLPIPPYDEQQQIATYLDNINAKIDKAIALKRQEIEKLKEYKTVLIDAAVTGKIKIA